MDIDAIAKPLGVVFRHPLFAILLVLAFVACLLYMIYFFFISKKTPEEKEIIFKRLDTSLDFVNLFFLACTTVIFATLLYFYRKMLPVQEQIESMVENTQTMQRLAKQVEEILNPLQKNSSKVLEKATEAISNVDESVLTNALGNVMKGNIPSEVEPFLKGATQLFT